MECCMTSCVIDMKFKLIVADQLVLIIFITGPLSCCTKVYYGVYIRLFLERSTANVITFLCKHYEAKTIYI